MATPCCPTPLGWRECPCPDTAACNGFRWPAAAGMHSCPQSPGLQDSGYISAGGKHTELHPQHEPLYLACQSTAQASVSKTWSRPLVCSPEIISYSNPSMSIFSRSTLACPRLAVMSPNDLNSAGPLPVLRVPLVAPRLQAGKARAGHGGARQEQGQTQPVAHAGGCSGERACGPSRRVSGSSAPHQMLW